MKRLFLALSLLFFGIFNAGAQFYSTGRDPFSVRWNYIESDSYKVIFPRGLDSLAREFALSLENCRYAVGGSIGMTPNEFYRKKMPVVLHPFTAYSNGSVAWAPRGMNLFTTPEAYDPEATPWIDQLAIHESRHVAQLQFGKGVKKFRFLNTLIGDLWTGTASGIYPGPHFLEGDAVVAETALTNTGRGRTADFLEYYKVALADSLYRDFWQWRWSSQKRYTPDHYRAGYVLLAGMRTLYDDPDFSADYFARLNKGLLSMNNLGKSIKASSGKKFKRSFQEIQEYFAQEWAAEDSLRAPFTEGRSFTEAGRLYDSYQSLVFAGDSLFAIHSGLDQNKELVLLDSSGRAHHIKYLPSQTSKLAWNGYTGQLLWSELKLSKFWDLSSSSIICSHANGQTESICKKGKLYNPAPKEDSFSFAAVSYSEDGSAAVVKMDVSGSIEEKLRAPSGLQPVEPVWVGEKLYVSAIVDDGFGIYDTEGWSPVLRAAPLKINHLFEKDGLIWFTSDLDGANNLYSLDPSSGELLQRSCMRFGGNSFAFSPSGDLYYSSLQTDGRVVKVLPAEELISKKVEFKARKWPVAEELSRQEKVGLMNYTGEISQAKPYSKLGNMVKVHSWAPMSVNYDFVERISMESTVTSGELGATLFFQNDLGTSSGSFAFGITAQEDTLGVGYSSDYIPVEFRPNAHLQYIYSGLPVIFELRADANDRQAHLHDIQIEKNDDDTYSLSVLHSKKDNAYLNLSARAYLPLTFSGGGWSRGIIPSLRFSIDNDEFNFVEYNKSSGFRKGKARAAITQLSLRGYSILPVNASGIYPHWGIGAEVGIIDCGEVSTSFPVYSWPSRTYGKMYGYVPGLRKTHGLRLEADFEQNYGSSFADYTSTTLKADYAFPFAAVDCSWLSPALYLRNFEGILHFKYNDLSIKYRTGNDPKQVSSLNLGITLQARLSNLLWVPYDSRIGVRVMHDFEDSARSGIELVTSIDL